MDLASDPATPARFPDDRSDSGLSSLRGGWSGDERSGSRSSALSGPDEPSTTTATTATVPGAPDAAKVQPSAAAAAPPVPAPAPAAANDSTVRVWRDPMVYTQGNVHHVDSVQHQSLLMAHPGQPAFAPHPVLHPDVLLKQRAPYAPHQFTPLPHELAYRRDLEKRTKEHEERQHKLAAEEAVHQHFAESLRLMQKQQHMQQQQQQQQQKQHELQQVLQHQQKLLQLGQQEQEQQDHQWLREQQIRARLIANQSRPPSASSQHSRTPPAPIKKEAQPSAGLPRMEPNFLPSGFSASNLAYADMAYLKPKQEPAKGILVSNKSPSGEMVLSNPPPLMSDVNNSVIVKNDTKSPVIHSQPKSQPHPNIPKLPHAHYQGGVPTVHKYEYPRSPSQSPHHLLSHEPQNLVGLSKGLPVQHHRGVPPPEHRGYPSKPGYAYQQYPLTSVAPAKPKVSSPAPPHMYGKPSAGIMTGTPVIRSQDSAPAVPLPLTSKAPASFQPAHRPSPPPAHSTRTVPSNSVPPMYDPRIYPSLKPPHSEPLGRLSPVPLVSDSLRKPPPDLRDRAPAEHYLLSSHHLTPGFMAHLRPMPSANAASFQTQPLDLGVSSADRASSPKRKGSPYSGALPLDKKARSDGPPQVAPPSQPQPLLSRVCEPSPLIANAATTIQTVINSAAYCPASSSPASLAAPAPGRTASGDGSLRPSSAGSAGGGAGGGPSGGPGGGSPAPGPGLAPPPVPSPAHIAAGTPPPGSCPSPAASPAPPVPTAATTPIKSTPTADSDKSNSPGLLKTPTAPSYPVHKLKKAWLQRHSGEDVSEDTSDVRGSGSSVTLPVRIDSPVAPPAAPVPTRSTPTPPSSSPSTAAKDTPRSALTSVRTPGPKTPRKGADVLLNGHTGKLHSDDTSSSDAEVKAAPAKRKPPKVKRKKGGNRRTVNDDGRRKKTQTRSESGSESERETASDKDSDSGASTKKTSSNGNATAATKEARKRGRRPKPSKDLDEEPRPKKPKDEPVTPPRDLFHKPPMAQLKKTGENFFQDGTCFEVAPKLAKCRECRGTANQRSKNMPNIFCRFYAFRRLRYTKNGQLAIAGFSNPIRDASEDDLKLWLPLPDSPPSDLDVETSTFLLTQVGDQFCDLLTQEKEAHEQHLGTDKVIAWKRVVQGVREMCDVCETTLFNFHWACGKCGFVVCLDCYKSRRDGTVKSNRTDVGKDRDDKAWLLCTNRQAHEQEKLMLTQIVAGDSLVKVGLKAHRLRTVCNIPQACGCPLSQAKTTNGLSKDVVKNQLKIEPVNGFVKTECNGYKPEDKNSPLSWLADVALSEDKKKTESVGSESDEDKDANFSTLRELLIRPAHKSNGSRSSSPDQAGSPANEESNTLSKGVRRQRTENNEDGNETISDGGKAAESELKHFVRRYMGGVNFRRGSRPMRIMSLTESQTLYPDVPHSWLCDGKLLKLTDAKNTANYRIFQDQWKRGQPVLISDVSKSLNKDLWSPSSFSRDFTDEKTDLINCMTGNLVPNQPMRKFWEGFECVSKRLRDDDGKAMLLKLKDWPPGEDFAEMMPTRFADLMQALPLADYTHRSGKLNLASRLPDCFVKPDLGPKMYIAYGSAALPSNKGTTNLHMDISDAVNVMVYVGIPRDGYNGDEVKEAFRAIDDAGCDILTRRRVRDKDELPGALWHIYSAQDADKIRDLLNKVAIERGDKLEPNHDPIHDQKWYLDGPLRERLYKEYHVEGYTIVQCLGDAIFIPAGAPHQVRNLHNCIKVAEDFVSPENISHCFHLMQEFRELSHQHTNHEDKLQIKNIIYHAVKDSLSVLSHAVVGGGATKEDADKPGTSNASSGSGSGSDSKGVSPTNGNSVVKTDPDN